MLLVPWSAYWYFIDRARVAKRFFAERGATQPEQTRKWIEAQVQAYDAVADGALDVKIPKHAKKELEALRKLGPTPTAPSFDVDGELVVGFRPAIVLGSRPACGRPADEVTADPGCRERPRCALKEGMPKRSKRPAPGSRSVNAGGDIKNNVIVTGDNNEVEARVRVAPAKLPAAGTIDIRAELASIRKVLARIESQDAGRIGRALDDADEEAAKAQPAKADVGEALRRALETASRTPAFQHEIALLLPHVTNAVGWLGSQWRSLLALVGLS